MIVNLKSLTLALATAICLAAGTSGLCADPSAAAFPFIGHHYEGTITALDNTAGTATIITKYGFKTMTVKVTPDTKIWKSVAAKPADVVVGDKVIVVGQEGADKDSMQINVVDVVPDFPPKILREKPKGHNRMLYGVVATTTPTLTVTDLNNNTVTLQTRVDGRFNAVETVLGDMNDLDNGVEIDVEGDVDGPVFNARSIVLNPDTIRPIRKNGKLKTNLATAPQAPAAPPAQPANTAPAAPSTATPPK